MNKIVDIADVPCPDSCNRPSGEKGCHFRAGPDAFTCTKCGLRIRRMFLGYELTSTDLFEMLHESKITSGEKPLTRRNATGDSAFTSKLVFNEKYEVRCAPKFTSREETDQVCPACGQAKLVLITKRDGSKFYGCANYPNCKHFGKYVPHTFNPKVEAPAAPAESAPEMPNPNPDPAKITPPPAVTEPAVPAPSFPVTQGLPADGNPEEDYEMLEIKLSGEPEETAASAILDPRGGASDDGLVPVSTVIPASDLPELPPDTLEDTPIPEPAAPPVQETDSPVVEPELSPAIEPSEIPLIAPEPSEMPPAEPELPNIPESAFTADPVEPEAVPPAADSQTAKVPAVAAPAAAAAPAENPPPAAEPAKKKPSDLRRIPNFVKAMLRLPVPEVAPRNTDMSIS